MANICKPCQRLKVLQNSSKVSDLCYRVASGFCVQVAKDSIYFPSTSVGGEVLLVHFLPPPRAAPPRPSGAEAPPREAARFPIGGGAPLFMPKGAGGPLETPLGAAYWYEG